MSDLPQILKKQPTAIADNNPLEVANRPKKINCLLSLCVSNKWEINVNYQYVKRINSLCTDRSISPVFLHKICSLLPNHHARYVSVRSWNHRHD